MSKSYRILIVDDEQDILDALEAAFLTTGLDVHTVNNPLTAFEMIKEAHFHVVISDIAMPQMNGLELLRKIKEYNALDASQQKLVELDQVGPLFGFLDDSFLNQTDDFIKEIDQAVRAVVQYLETTETPGGLKKIGEILVGKGKIGEQDLADARHGWLYSH